MTLANDFGRDDCQVGKKRITYAKLEREYRCADCGGRLTTYFLGDPYEYQNYNEWGIRCAICHGIDFIHERKWILQKAEAAEVLDNLPPELAAQLK